MSNIFLELCNEFGADNVKDDSAGNELVYEVSVKDSVCTSYVDYKIQVVCDLNGTLKMVCVEDRNKKPVMYSDDEIKDVKGVRVLYGLVSTKEIFKGTGDFIEKEFYRRGGSAHDHFMSRICAREHLAREHAQNQLKRALGITVKLPEGEL